VFATLSEKKKADPRKGEIVHVLHREKRFVEEKEKDHSHFNEADLFLFLEKRRGKLDAVVVSGGEPTMQADLPEFIRKVKNLGFKIKLDSNGTNPEMLKKLLAEGLIDYLAMDLKAAPVDYEKATGVKFDFNKIKESVKIIMNSGLPYEFRTTVVPGLLEKDDFAAMGEAIKGAKKWYLQFFKSDTDLVDVEYETHPPYTKKEMAEFAKIGSEYVDLCEVRE